MAKKNMHPLAQLNALELAIVENATALLIECLPKGDFMSTNHDRIAGVMRAVLVGARYQAQGTAEGAETIAAAIDRLTRAVAPRLERIEVLLSAKHAANDPTSSMPGTAD